MTVVDIALAVLAAMAAGALLTRIADHWLSLPCKREHDEHERGDQ